MGIVIIIETVLIVLIAAFLIYLFKKTALADLLLCAKIKIRYGELTTYRYLLDNYDKDLLLPQKDCSYCGFNLVTEQDLPQLWKYLNWVTRKMRKEDAQKFKFSVYNEVRRRVE